MLNFSNTKLWILYKFKVVSENTKLIKKLSIALIKMNSVLSRLIKNLFCAPTKAFSANKGKVSIGYEILFCTSSLGFNKNSTVSSTSGFQ